MPDSDITIEARSLEVARLIRHVGLVGIGCVMTGMVVGGLGGRLVMRIAGSNAPRSVRGARTEAGFRVGEITLGGTIELIIFIGIFVGIAGAAVYVVSEPWLTWTGRWRGPALGLDEELRRLNFEEKERP